jgi:glycosyltransferase involved in cell wall biosynthesis
VYLLAVTGPLTVLLLLATRRARRALSRWARLPLEDPPPASLAPHVSVLVPARDEARGIEACVVSLLGQAYPRDRLRVVVVDDESTDATRAILARLARHDDRLRVVAGRPPPVGWTGKCWALHQALRHAHPASEYLLLTDADTLHHPRALASAVGFSRRRGIDVLSLGTGQALIGQAERLLLPLLLGLAMSANGTLDEVNDPARPDVAKANGQYLLVTRAAYAALGGHAAVRSAAVEDFELARRAKRLGYRLMLADGRALVHTRGYRSAAEIWRGFAKNALAEAGYHPAGIAVALLGLPALTLGPWLLLVYCLRRLRERPRLVHAALLAQASIQLAEPIRFTAGCAAALGLPARYGLAQPLASLFLWLLLMATGTRRLSGRPPTWKGRPLPATAARRAP